MSTRKEKPAKRRCRGRSDTGTAHEQTDLVTELIFDTVIDELAQRIEAGVNDATRETLARVLNNWCVLTRTCSVQARNDKRFGAVMLYERFRLRKTVFNVREQQGYLSGVPRYVAVFGALDAAPSHPTVMQKAMHNSIASDFEFTPMVFVDDLTKAIGAFERLTAALTMGRGSRHSLETTRPAIPESCTALINRIRGHHESRSTCRCEHASCRRRFVHVEQEAYEFDGWPQSMDRFADTITFLTMAERPRRRSAQRFCSDHCARQWRVERATLNDAIACARANACAPRGWSAFVGTIDRELHGALKRNASTVHAINQWTAKHFGARNRALRTVAVEAVVCDWVKPANIEVGMLYASSHLTACTHRAKTLEWLPGKDPMWRDEFVTSIARDALGYDASSTTPERQSWKGTEQTIRLINFVAFYYTASGHPNVHPISQKDLLSPPRFLRSIRTHVVKWNML